MAFRVFPAIVLAACLMPSLVTAATRETKTKRSGTGGPQIASANSDLQSLQLGPAEGGLGSPLDGVTGLSATAVNGTKIRLNWIDATSDETGFKIERSATPSGPFGVIAMVSSNTTEWFDRSVYPATSYSYRIVATNDAGDASPSSVATVSTPLNSTIYFLTLGNSYSGFTSFLPGIASNRGDAVTLSFATSNTGARDQIAAEIAIEQGDNSPATLSNALIKAGATYVRLKTLLDSQPWDNISVQPHSSWANKSNETLSGVSPTRAYLDSRYPGAQLCFYFTTQYRNDEHLFRNLVNSSVHRGVVRPGYPYTEDQHAFDALVVTRGVVAAEGVPVCPGGIALQNARYHPLVGETAPDPYFDYFYATTNSAKPYFPRRLHYGFYWEPRYNPKFPWWIDSHPLDECNYLTACAWYEILFRKSVLPVTYKPAGWSEQVAAALRQVAHDTVQGLLPRLRLAHPESRLAYGDILWESAETLMADADPEKQAIGLENLVTLYMCVPEHIQAVTSTNLLDAAGKLATAQALATQEALERPIREAIYARIWDSSLTNNPVTIDLGPNGDPDDDGIPSLVELALHLNPHANDQSRLPSVSVIETNGNHWLTLTHRKELVRTNFVIGVESSMSLSNASWSTLTNNADFITTVTDPNLDGDGHAQGIEQRVRIPADADRLFLRLKITQ